MCSLLFAVRQGEVCSGSWKRREVAGRFKEGTAMTCSWDKLYDSPDSHGAAFWELPDLAPTPTPQPPNPHPVSSVMAAHTYDPSTQGNRG